MMFAPRIVAMMENAPDDDDKNTYMDFHQLLKVQKSRNMPYLLLTDNQKKLLSWPSFLEAGL